MYPTSEVALQQQTVAEINLSALRANYRALAAMARPAAMIPPVKAEAYGHGAVAVARCLAAEGAALFAVVTLNEALELRAAGISQDILVMGVVDPARATEAVGAGVVITLHSRDHARQAASAARHSGGRLRCHVKVDTGMGRLGVAADETVAVFEDLAGSEAVSVEGLMTHLSHAEDEDLAMTEVQLARFRELVETLRQKRLCPKMVHAANSAAVLRCPAGVFTGVRPGFALYGASPCPEHAPSPGLRPILTLRSVVALVKEIAPGQGVSYSHTWHAGRRSRIAAIPIGYADGYCRLLSNRAQVRVEGRLAPVVGNVCMDTTLVDVTDVPSARVGSPVTLIEADASSPLSVHALARLAGTIPHEIMTGLGGRVRRVYVDEQ